MLRSSPLGNVGTALLKKARSATAEEQQVAQGTVVAILRLANSPPDLYAMIPTTLAARIVNSPAQLQYVVLL